MSTLKMDKMSFLQVRVPAVYPTARRHKTKLIGYHGGLQVGKWAVHDEQAPWNDPYVAYMTIVMAGLGLSHPPWLVLLSFIELGLQQDITSWLNM